MSEEDIETFLAFSGAFDRSTASIFLKVCRKVGLLPDPEVADIHSTE